MVQSTKRSKSKILVIRVRYSEEPITCRKHPSLDSAATASCGLIISITMVLLCLSKNMNPEQLLSMISIFSLMSARVRLFSNECETEGH